MKRILAMMIPGLFCAAVTNAQALTGSTLNLNTTLNTLCPNNVTSLTILNQQPGYSSGTFCPGISTNNIVDIQKRLYGSGGTPVGAAVPVFSIQPNGAVWANISMRIGPTAANGTYANYRLSVDGDIIAKRCVVQVSNWADYVFAPDYTMPSLAELENYVHENKHLPGVPSEAEVADKGIEMGEMNKILLQKVEELTLYMIDMKKQNEAAVTALRNEIKALKEKSH